MKYIKKAFLFGLTGIFAGVFINQAILLSIMAIRHLQTVSFSFLLLQFIVSCALGFAFGAVAVVFSIDSWSILRQTTVHFLVMAAVYLPCALIAGWVPAQPAAIASFCAIFVCIYVCIWLAQYFTWRRRIRSINHSLAGKKMKQ